MKTAVLFTRHAPPAVTNTHSHALRDWLEWRWPAHFTP
jgi:hypothetical protein